MSTKSLYKACLKCALICCAIFTVASVNASINSCKNVQLSPSEDTKLHIIAYAEPEFESPKLKSNSSKPAKSDVSLFSWLTESHTMPSLHFIDLIELFGTDNEQQ